MMSTESANSFTLIGEASDGGTMENLSRRLKASQHRSSIRRQAWLVEGVAGQVAWGRPSPDSPTPHASRSLGTFLTSCQARQMWITHCVRNAQIPF